MPPKPAGQEYAIDIADVQEIVQVPAQIIQAMLAESGINLVIDTQENVTGLNNGAKGDFEALFSFWSGRPDPDGNTFQFFKTQQGSGLNWAGYSNPKVDEILDKTREASDQGERKKLYSELVKILQDDCPWLFVIHPVEPKAFTPKLQAYDPIPDGMMRFKNVWLKA